MCRVRTCWLLLLTSAICAGVFDFATLNDGAGGRSANAAQLQLDFPNAGPKPIVNIRPWYRFKPKAGQVHHGWKLSLRHLPSGNHDFDALKKVAKLTSDPLELDGLLVAAIGLERVAAMRNVESLQLSDHAAITNDGLKMLQKLPRLRRISFHGRSVTNAGLEHLAVHKHLESLRISQTRIDGAGLVHLKNFPELKELVLSNVRMDRVPGLVHLTSLKNLQHLSLSRNRAYAKDIAHLKELTNLQSLDLFERIEDDHFAYFSGMEHLRSLRVRSHDLSPNAIRHLKNLNHLRFVRGTISEEAKATIRHVLPRVALQETSDKLREETEVEFTDTPLVDALEFLTELHDMPITVDDRSLAAAGVETDTPVNLIGSGFSFKSALGLVLEPLELAWIVRTDGITITSQETADKTFETRYYDFYQLIPDDDIDELARLASKIVQFHSWNLKDQPVSISVEGTSLKVTHNQRVHALVATLLEGFESDGFKASHRQFPAEDRIRSALGEETDIRFVNTPISHGFEFIAELHNITTHLDEPALKELGIDSDSDELTATINGVSLETALTKLLKPRKLTFVVKHETLFVTSQEWADKMLTLRTYQIPLEKKARGRFLNTLTASQINSKPRSLALEFGHRMLILSTLEGHYHFQKELRSAK